MGTIRFSPVYHELTRKHTPHRLGGAQRRAGRLSEDARSSPIRPRVLSDLNERAREKPFMAELSNFAGDTLALGLGRDESILSWVAANGDPPYYASKGDEHADGTVVFYYRGTWSEFPRWSAVPIESAFAAMRQFFETEQLPNSITWEEV